jgi:hypothetical protein
MLVKAQIDCLQETARFSHFEAKKGGLKRFEAVFAKIGVVCFKGFSSQ